MLKKMTKLTAAIALAASLPVSAEIVIDGQPPIDGNSVVVSGGVTWQTAQWCWIENVHYNAEYDRYTGELYIGDNWDTLELLDPFTSDTVTTTYGAIEANYNTFERWEWERNGDGFMNYNPSGNRDPWVFEIQGLGPNSGNIGFQVSHGGGQAEWCGMIDVEKVCRINNKDAITTTSHWLDTETIQFTTDAELDLTVTGYDNATVLYEHETINDYDAIVVNDNITVSDDPATLHYDVTVSGDALNKQVVDRNGDDILKTTITLECK